MTDGVSLSYNGGELRVEGKSNARKFFTEALTGPSAHMLGNYLLERHGNAIRATCSGIACEVRRLTLRSSDGTITIMTTRALISAVGQLNRPMIPDIKGRALFKGLQVHSAQWQPQTNLQGLRVAVIGTGATAVQLVPEVAKAATLQWYLGFGSSQMGER